MQDAKKGNGFSEEGKAIPDINTDNKTDDNTDNEDLKSRLSKNERQKKQGGENQGLVTEQNYIKDCDIVIDYLNQACETNYRHAKGTRDKIMPRLKEGFTVDECKSVIDKKAREWKGTEWEKYLTPDTLFRPSNFEKYLNQKINKSSRIQSVPEYMKQATVQQDQDDDKDDLINEIREMQERMKKGC